MPKNFIKKGFYKIAAKKEGTILERISDFNVISFDVFDTLLKRDVQDPKDVFLLIEKELVKCNCGIFENFAETRVQAERQARQLHPEREVTLSEIYEQIPCDEDLQKKLMKMECETEAKVSAPNIPIKRVYEKCVQEGKRVYFISDMYLPEKCVSEILKKNGYTKGKLYVSSQSGYTKTTGKLFQYVQKEEDIKPKQWAHIGDTIRSDYLATKKLGITSILINRNTRHNPYVDRKTFRENENYRLLNHYIDNHIEKYVDPYERIGYAVLGPILYGFVRWLEEKVPKDELCIFLARDALIIRKAFSLISQRPSEYFYISRNSVRVPYVNCLKGPEDVFDRHGGMRKRTVQSLAKGYGLNDEEIQKAFPAAASEGETTIENKSEKMDILRTIWPVVQEKARVQFELLQQYISQQKYPEKCAVVDIGWDGTIQALLSKCNFTSGSAPIKWSGYYLGSFQNNPDPLYEGITKNCFLFDPLDPQKNRRIHDSVKYSHDLFELLFLATHGSTLKYRRKEDGSVEPLLGKEDNDEDTIDKIGRMQRAALEFVRGAALSPLETRTLDAASAAGNYIGFARVPTMRTIELFRNINFEDGRGAQRLINAKRTNFYMLHPKAFIKDLVDSQCKSWFLKSVIRLPLPYIHILNVLRALFFKEAV